MIYVYKIHQILDIRQSTTTQVRIRPHEHPHKGPTCYWIHCSPRATAPAGRLLQAVARECCPPCTGDQIRTREAQSDPKNGRLAPSGLVVLGIGTTRPLLGPSPVPEQTAPAPAKAAPAEQAAPAPTAVAASEQTAPAPAKDLSRCLVGRLLNLLHLMNKTPLKRRSGRP